MNENTELKLDYKDLFMSELRHNIVSEINQGKEMTRTEKLIIVLPKMLTFAFTMVSLYFGLQILMFLTYFFTFE